MDTVIDHSLLVTSDFNAACTGSRCPSTRRPCTESSSSSYRTNHYGVLNITVLCLSKIFCDVSKILTRPVYSSVHLGSSNNVSFIASHFSFHKRLSSVNVCQYRHVSEVRAISSGERKLKTCNAICEIHGVCKR